MEALEELLELKAEFEEWRDNLPENVQGSITAEKLDAVCDIDLEQRSSIAREAEGVELPLGFGRD